MKKEPVYYDNEIGWRQRPDMGWVNSRMFRILLALITSIAGLLMVYAGAFMAIPINRVDILIGGILIMFAVSVDLERN